MTAALPSQLIFGKYQIVRRIAVGGMGEIYLARQVGLPGFERMAILKSLLPDLAAEPGFVDQFLDEARVAATLNHPNVVAIYEVGQWEEIYYIAMEYIAGRNLLELRRTSLNPPPVEVSLSIIRDAARGLDHAHHAVDVNGRPLHIVHRDVSPQNIMVRQDGVTKVVDFGIARANNREGRTATGMIKGKLAYMSPEQLSGKAVDGRTDQFALGAVLWEMLTGVRLFRGENDLETSLKVLSAPIPKPSQQLATVPPALDAVVMRMLERDPALRYPRLAAAADDLERVAMTYGPGTGERHVSAFVATLPAMAAAGAKAKPQGSGNFVISLGEPGPTPPPKPEQYRLPAPPAAAHLADEAVPSEEATTVARSDEVSGEQRKLPRPPTPAAPPAPSSSRPGVALVAGGVSALAVVVGLIAVLAMRPAAPVAPVVVEVAPRTPAAPPPRTAPGAATEPPQVELRFEVQPAGATVRLDGAPLTSPMVKLVAGHASKVVVEAAGFVTRELSVAPTHDEVVKVALQPAPPVRPATAAPHAPSRKGPRRQSDKLIMDKGDIFN